MKNDLEDLRAFVGLQAFAFTNGHEQMILSRISTFVLAVCHCKFEL